MKVATAAPPERYVSPAVVDYGSIADLTATTTGFPGLSAGCLDCGPVGGGGGGELPGGGGGEVPGGGGGEVPGGGGGHAPGGGDQHGSGGDQHGGGGVAPAGGQAGGPHTTTTTTSTATTTTTTTTTSPSGHGETGGSEVAGAQTTGGGGGLGALGAVGAAAAGGLPFTGFPIWAAVLIGILLVSVGILLLRVAQRRRVVELAPVHVPVTRTRDGSISD